MRLQSIILAVCFFSVSYLHSQVLGQDKTGFSSIVQPSSTFNLDLTDKVATLNYYEEARLRDFKQDKSQSNEECNVTSTTENEYITKLRTAWNLQDKAYRKLGLVYGGELKGSSSDGVSLLVKDEQVMTGSSISLLAGLRWYKRVYNFKDLGRYAKATYWKNTLGSADEKTLIADIEKEVQKLADAQIITASKKIDLLHFKSAESREDKLESINSKIKSVLDEKGFISSFNDKNKLEDLVKNLAKLIDDISSYEEDVKNYEDLKKLARSSSNDVEINKMLDKMNENLKSFQTAIDAEDIKALKLSLEASNTKWATNKEKLNKAREAASYNVYKFNTRAGSYSSEALIASYRKYKEFLEDKSKIASEEETENLRLNTYSIQRNMLYIRAGFTNNAFKYDLANDSTSIDDRFVDKNIQGYRLELGYTRQFKRYNFLGFNFSLGRTSNVEQLTTTTYKFEKTDTTVVPNIKTATEMKALSGVFDTFIKYGLSFDYAYLIPFHKRNLPEEQIKSNKLLLSVNPFVRHNFYSKTETLKPNTSAGLGLYCFNKENGSIAGGLFIQADDIFNVNREEAVNFTKQISVGIIFKVAIKSFNPAAK